METLSKHTRLETLAWPVFRLGEKAPQHDNGVVFYYTHYVDEHNSESLSIRVVDDTTLPQATLGLRRLILKSQEQNLYPIRTAIYFLADLIKLAKATTWFIDSSGHVFQYEKNTRAKLQTKRITKVLPADGLGCVIELQGISSRFKSLQRPSEHELYAKVLKLGMGFIFYGFCETATPDSWRMI